MKIIKPYGRSHVDAARAKGAPLERRLRLTDNPDPLQDIPTFAREHDWLVLAQWISAIDKIATKPKSGGRPRQNSGHCAGSLGTRHGNTSEAIIFWPGSKSLLPLTFWKRHGA